MQTTIYLVRHGETEWNREGILQGWLDSPLTKEGKMAAMALRGDLKAIEFDCVFSSDLGRAIETAMLIAPNMRLQQDARIREIYLGEWQGSKIENLLQTKSYQLYSNEPHLFKPTTQESFASVTKRMIQFFKDVNIGGNILIVSHGVAIMCLLAHIKGLPLARLWEHGIVEGASVIHLQNINGHLTIKKDEVLN